MKKITILLFSFLFSSYSFSQLPEMKTTSRLIVKFKTHKKPNTIDVQTQQRFNNSGVDLLNNNNNLKSIELTGNKKEQATFVLDLDSSKPIEELIAMYQKTGLFEYVEQDFIGTGHGFQMTPNDTHYNRQWSHYNDGSFNLSNATVDADIDTDLAWEITQGDPNLIVAILDTGAKLDHPEFFGRIWINLEETIDGSDTDGNGYIDDRNGGWDFVNDDNKPFDDHGHGTNVAGIALASGNNNLGYAGMNWKSEIMICKVLDEDNSGYYSWWAEAIYYAVDNGASVINLSAGGIDASTTLEDAIDYAYSNNVAVVVSTGNQNSTIQYPARYEKAFAIDSTNSDDTRSVPFFWDVNSGSNYGAELDFVAPGHFILGLSHTSNTNYNGYWGGTSQGAPHVAGLISLLLSVNPNLTIDQIRAILEETSEDQVGDSDDTVGWDQYYGHGRINAFQALKSPLLSVASSEPSAAFTIYPNPVNHTFKINKDVNVLDIYDLTGKRIKSFKGDFTMSDNFDISDLNQSMYFIKIQNKEGQVLTSKLIKL